jgi:hypothetical protein
MRRHRAALTVLHTPALALVVGAVALGSSPSRCDRDDR